MRKERLQSGAPKVEANNLRVRNETRPLIFYGVSLLLSLIIIIIATTVFVAVIYIEGQVTQNFFFLFIGIIGANLVISGVSLRGIIKSYTIVFRKQGNQKTFIMPSQADFSAHDLAPEKKMLNKEYFSEVELEIIELLRNNKNQMLQSAIVGNIEASKASVSRALTSLENKDIIVKMRKGVTNEIILSETYSK